MDFQVINKLYIGRWSPYNVRGGTRTAPARKNPLVSGIRKGSLIYKHMGSR